MDEHAEVEVFYSVAETAEIFSVCKQTVMKWLKDESVIPASDWFCLPGSGYIRIRESGILNLQRNS